jgi:DNA-binding HxlR family transcriptional regulator
MGNRINSFGACSIEVKKACPIEMTLQMIGGKWKGIIIYILSERAVRFNELKRLIPGITQRMLTLQLRELEADGIIRRNVENSIPKKVEYFLTDQGESLSPIVESMRTWGNEYLGKNT